VNLLDLDAPEPSQLVPVLLAALLDERVRTSSP
jgi:hypothetical protein